MELHIFTQGDMRDFDLLVEERDAAIAIQHARIAQTEDILGGGIGLGQRKRTEEAGVRLSGILEAQVGDLASRGMDLMVVVPVDLVAQDAPDFFQAGEVLQGTGDGTLRFKEKPYIEVLEGC